MTCEIWIFWNQDQSPPLFTLWTTFPHIITFMRQLLFHLLRVSCFDGLAAHSWIISKLRPFTKSHHHHHRSLVRIFEIIVLMIFVILVHVTPFSCMFHAHGALIFYVDVWIFSNMLRPFTHQPNRFKIKP